MSESSVPKVLIVDDSKTAAKVLKNALLEVAGIEIIIENGI